MLKSKREERRYHSFFACCRVSPHLLISLSNSIYRPLALLQRDTNTQSISFGLVMAQEERCILLRALAIHFTDNYRSDLPILPHLLRLPPLSGAAACSAATITHPLDLTKVSLFSFAEVQVQELELEANSLLFRIPYTLYSLSIVFKLLLSNKEW